MEKIQERALRFIYDDYVSTYDDLLNKSKLPSLKIRRLRSIILETFMLSFSRFYNYSSYKKKEFSCTIKILVTRLF